MSVLIQINGENAGEAIRELSALASGIAGQAAPAVVASAEAPKQTRSSRKTETPKETPATQLEPEKEPEAVEPDHGEVPSSDEPIPTDVDLRAVASAIGAKGPEAKKAIKALLDKYGVPNITAVPADQRISFKVDLEDIE